MKNDKSPTEQICHEFGKIMKKHIKHGIYHGDVMHALEVLVASTLRSLDNFPQAKEDLEIFYKNVLLGLDFIYKRQDTNQEN